MSAKVTVNRFTRLTNTEDCDTSCSSCSWNQISTPGLSPEDLSAEQEVARAMARKEHLMQALERVEATIATASAQESDRET
jgi:2-iminoacetate synthase ThiH